MQARFRGKVAALVLALDPTLAPLAAVLTDSTLRALAENTLAWARAAKTVGSEASLGRLVVVASAYARLCAPADASMRSFEVAARFVLLFLLLDDADVEHLPELEAGELWTIGPHTGALRSWLDDFHEMRSGPAALQESLTQSYHAYLVRRRAERSHKATRLSIEEHWAVRRHTIFTEPYLDQWMLSLSIDPSRVSPLFGDARKLATDAVLLANDLGSVARDSVDGEAPDDLNLVDTYAAERGWSRVEAIDPLIEVHRDIVGRYLDAVSGALRDRPGADAVRYESLLTGLVDGNTDALVLLEFRYPGVAAILGRLARARSSPPQ